MVYRILAQYNTPSAPRSTKAVSWRSAGLLAALLPWAAADVRGVTISGTVAYEGSYTAQAVCIVAVPTVDSWTSAYSTTSMLPAGAFAVSNVPASTAYWVRAYLDVNGDGAHQTVEPGGSHIPNPVNATADVTGLDIVLADNNFDFDGWTNGTWDLCDITVNAAKIHRFLGSNYLFYAGTNTGVGGTGSMVIDLAANGWLEVRVRLASAGGGGYPVYGTVPSAGRRYRISFDGRSDRVNHVLKVYWCYCGFISEEPSRSNALFRIEDAVLLGTNWQHYSRVVYFEQDDRFVRFGSPSSALPYYDLYLKPACEGTYYVDNLTMTEIPWDFSIPELENRGFERGYYGWTDAARWAQAGVGDPSAETNIAHWRVSTNNPRSGRYCLEAVLPPFTNYPWTFNPSLIGGGVTLERGGNYLLSYWQRADSFIPVRVGAIDHYHAGHTRMVACEETNWTRVLFPLYRYGDRPGNTNYPSWPAAGRPVQLFVGPLHYPWTCRIAVDDFELVEVDEATAYAIVTNGAASAPPWTDIAETNDPYYLATALPEAFLFRVLEPTNDLSLPVRVEKNDPAAADSGTLSLLISDYAGEPVHTQAVPFTLVDGVYTAAVPVDGFRTNGQWPEGLFVYAFSMAGVTQRASDRFFVRAASPVLAGLDPDRGFVAIDRFDVGVPSITITSETPRFALGMYDVAHFMKLFADIGARYVKFWINGDSYYDEDFLEEAIDLLVTNGFAPFIALDGYVGPPTNLYNLSHNNFVTRWDEEAWRTFVSNLAVRFHGKVWHWEVANEPYDYPAADYLKLLTNTYLALKGVDTNNVVHAFDQQLSRAATHNMIDSVYQMGGTAFSDVMDYHDYGLMAENQYNLDWCMEIVRRHEDGKTSYASPGEYYLGPSNSAVWQTEFNAHWSKIAQGNRVSDVERETASVLLRRMLMAKAYDVKKYIVYNVVAAPRESHMFTIPLHRGAGGPGVCMHYACCAALSDLLVLRDLKRVYEFGGIYAFGFGATNDTNVEVVAAWASGPGTPLAVASGFPEVRMTRMDGSERVIGSLTLTDEPVYLESLTGAPYDWGLIFGTNSFRVR